MIEDEISLTSLFSCLSLWRVQAERLHGELCRSEARREEAERKVMRLTDVANQMEETRKVNDSLIAQVFN